MALMPAGAAPLADLHVHSAHSDGALSASQIVRRAIDVGITTLAITDHDTVGAAVELADEAPWTTLTFIPGAEWSARYEGKSVHLLSYGIDPRHPRVTAMADRAAQIRSDRSESILGMLARRGVDLKPSDFDRPLASVTRSHIADALVARGTVSSKKMAFAQFLGPKWTQSFDHAWPSVSTIIADVHEAGGVTVVAHPGHQFSDHDLDRLCAWGLDGIEVYHPSHDASLVSFYAKRAMSRGLLVSGGSDFHSDEQHPNVFGQLGIAHNDAQTFVRALQQRDCVVWGAEG